MITLTTAGLHIDNSCFGSGMLLTRVTPYKAYQDGKPLNDVAGYKYAVVLPSRAYEMLEVQVPGAKAMDLNPGESIPVTFDNLRVRPYFDFKRNALAFTAQADGIHKADGKH